MKLKEKFEHLLILDLFYLSVPDKEINIFKGGERLTWRRTDLEMTRSYNPICKIVDLRNYKDKFYVSTLREEKRFNDIEDSEDNLYLDIGKDNYAIDLRGLLD